MNIVDKNSVGNRIKALRMSMGLTLEEFGSRLYDANKGAVNNWEKGRSIPNNKRLKKIAEIANTTVEELLYGSFESYCAAIFDNVINKRKSSLDDDIQDRAFLQTMIDVSQENLTYSDTNRIKEIILINIDKEIPLTDKDAITFLRNELEELASDFTYMFYEPGVTLKEMLSTSTNEKTKQRKFKEGADATLYIDLLKLLVQTDKEAVQLAKKYNLSSETSSKGVQNYYDDELFMLEYDQGITFDD